MSRIAELFRNKSKNILNVYCTAGFPKLDSTQPLMKALQENGADIIELGIPYSDPLADGPVIQQSSSVALQNGMTIQTLFRQLRNFRKEIHLPVILMGYMNPVLQYGFERFCAEASAIGIDGLILPDLPVNEFETEYRSVINKYGLDFIFLVTPETPEERVKKLDQLSTGFLYAVSSSSTTGSGNKMDGLKDYLKKLHDLDLTNPVLVGFGITDKTSFETVCGFANGAIIGSAFIKTIGNTEDPALAAAGFLRSILH
jgi:tryptophan synthase alpha chain